RGPFSHLFDGKFIPAVIPNSKWKHEDASVMMFDYLIKKHNLKGEFKKYDLVDQDIKFIKEQIAGPKQNGERAADNEQPSAGVKREEIDWPYLGREHKKGFLYEIVANKRNGIDVDRWDYFARDCYGLGIKNTFDHSRFMKFARVLKVEDEYQICSRDKEAETLYGMFQIRATLHRRAYQHRVCDAIEAIFTHSIQVFLSGFRQGVLDAFIAANHIGIIPGKDGKLKKLSECIDDPEAYTNLTDSIFHVILMSADKNLEKSRKILQRIMHRKLYACVGETTPTEGESYGKSSKIKAEIMSYIPPQSEGELLSDDLYVDLVYLDYGSKSKNPMSNVRFYNKREVTKPVRIEKNQVSLMLPTVFAEQIIRLYCKKNDNKSLMMASECFQKWCRDNNHLSQIKNQNVFFYEPQSCYIEGHYVFWLKFLVKFQTSSLSVPGEDNSGNAGDSLASHNGVGFSTFDNDNDVSNYNNAEEWHGGWWYSSNEISSNLHGKYIFGEADRLREGFFWGT
ncbi:Hypothetical predicted protein, partial [Mytilus galloprovincialis]